jgi:hypothetical protein
MSEGSFTTELVNQGMKAERECQKFQALLDDKIPNSTFKWCQDKNEILLYKRKRERTVIHNDNDEDDDEDEPEVKPKHDILFKRDEDDNDDDNDDQDDNADDNDENDDNVVIKIIHKKINDS